MCPGRKITFLLCPCFLFSGRLKVLRQSVRPERVEGREVSSLVRIMSFWVYILRCADGSYYTGHTDDLPKRLAEHQTGQVAGYTSTRRPVRLLFSEEFPTREETLASEQRIKGWSRKKKEAMMRGDWMEVSRLAKGKRPIP